MDAAMSDELILVDLLDTEVGSATKLEAHQRGLLHRAFSVFLLDGSRVLLQRRAEGKYHSGGLWTNSCCSHPRVGEEVLEAAVRRLPEELGVSGVALREVGSFVYRCDFGDGITEYELDHVLVGEYAGPVVPNPEEASEVRWVELAEAERMAERTPGQVTVWFPNALRLVLAAQAARGDAGVSHRTLR